MFKEIRFDKSVERLKPLGFAQPFEGESCEKKGKMVDSQVFLWVFLSVVYV